MRNRNMFTYLIASILVVVLIGTISGMIMNGMKDNPYKVSVVVVDSSSVRWNSFYNGLQQAAKDYNIKLNIVSTSAGVNMDQELKLLNEEIEEGAQGVILQVDNSKGTENLISEISSKVVLELVDTSADADVDVEGKYACIEADNTAIGRSLASELRIALGNDLSRYKIGLIVGNQKQYSMQQRRQGFMDAIESTGVTIAWEIGDINNKTNAIRYRQKEDERVDILVALCDDGLEAVCEYALWTGDEVYIFGEGNSIRNVAYVDHGLIDSMIVPNEYYMGYQSLVAVYSRLENKLTPMMDEVVPYKVINRDNLFSEENQRLMFPIN